MCNTARRIAATSGYQCWPKQNYQSNRFDKLSQSFIIRKMCYGNQNLAIWKLYDRTQY